MTARPMKRMVVMVWCFNCLCLVGCADFAAGDLRDMELARALAVDVADVVDVVDVADNDIYNKEEIVVNAWLLHRDKALDEQYADSYYRVTAAGDGTAAALADVAGAGARQVNFAHTGLLLTGEKVAPNDWLSYALQATELRPTVYPVVVLGQAAEWAAQDVDGVSPFYLLGAALEPAGRGHGGAMAVTVQEFATALYQPGMAAALPYVQVTRLAGLAVWADDGWRYIPMGDEVLAWQLLVRGRQLQSEVLAWGGVAVRLNRVDVRRQVEVSADGVKIRMLVKVGGEVAVNTERMAKQEIEQRLSGRVQEACRAALAWAVAENVDYLGIGREIWRRCPEVWQKISENGTAYLQNVAVEFAVEAEVSGGD